MLIVQHRVNTIEELIKSSKNFGIEIDIRTKNNKFIIQHDPFKEGTNLNEWLRKYNNKLLILNVKEEGLEDLLMEEMKSFKINNFFFLDQSYPSIIRYAKKGEKRIAIRFSEYESIENIKLLKNLINWVWVDCFNECPLNKITYKIMKDCNFKICLVSPELQGYSLEKVKYLKNYIFQNELIPDAVCTKFTEIWK